LINQSFSKVTKRGGARPGSGRKPKATEMELIERLTPMEDEALRQLELGVRSGDYNFIKLFMEYRYGKPKQQIDMTSKDKELQGFAIIIDGNTSDKGN